MVNVRTNPYQAPGTGVDVEPPSADWRRAAKVFAGWIAGASLVSGAISALRAGYALHAFSADGHIAGIVAIGALRGDAAHVAASAASVALVAMTHRRSIARLDSQRSKRPWQIYAVVPFATPIAACMMSLAGGGVATLGFNVAPGSSWEEIRRYVLLTDALHGLVVACLFASILGVIAAAASSQLGTIRQGLITKIIVALFVTQVVTGVVGAVLESALPSQKDLDVDGAAHVPCHEPSSARVALPNERVPSTRFARG
jgi:hypothetical protein